LEAIQAKTKSGPLTHKELDEKAQPKATLPPAAGG
jgi:hypothetical protein